jgi:hypothetical protein
VIGRRWDESESRLQECAVVADHRAIVVAGPTLADIRVSYVTPSLRHGTVYSAKAALSATITDYCEAKNGTSQP